MIDRLEPLFATSSLCHSEARNGPWVALSNWGSKKYVMKQLRFESHKIITLVCFFAFGEKGPFLNLINLA